MKLFLIGLILCLIALCIILALYINYKRQEEKQATVEEKAKAEKAVKVYEEEKKENEKILIDVNTVNCADKLQELAAKGHRRGTK